ncbi:hypothetical protein AQPE_2966 [Aquipluma nitroreducens]|uniref:DUF362 domain-containing protein n=1 Tax=Aquipluma nitroreducens TaxID=2010828 RepID=A0A5K7SB45_9BACT|nr:DUF362 domain-containing protein [Aquipluma nitroreducens]BBE18798.1 hypothetical protein AQPE_2966 [Aquipluma nitroreducens]
MKSLIQFLKKYRESSVSNPIFGKLIFLSLGIATTVWFLIRVIPKPQRAAYPCMQASAPVMSGFVIYLLTLTGTFKAFRLAQLNFKKARYFYFIAFLVVAFGGSIAFFVQNPENVFANSTPEWIITPNAPVGTSHGINPGRVVWVHNPKAANWNGSTGFWWDDKYNSQPETDKMMNRTLLSLTGEKSLAKAWKALFVSFNQTKKGNAEGYQPNQKIAVKINANNNSAQTNSNEINASPQMTLALLRTMIHDAGIPQKNISVFDASRFITDNIYDKCHAEFPEVIFVDNVGGNGRVKSTYVERAIPYSVDNGKLDQGLATCAVEADYLINVALLKGHVGQGVTLCGKNYYGVTSINSDWRKNAHDNFDQNREGKPKYMTFVDFLGHKDLGGKTMLFLIDGLYGAKLVNGIPAPKWQMAPFNNNWPSSLFASQDGVAIDAVGLDFIRSEWPDALDIKFSDQYLIEAAQANNPPSKAVYDPERDGSKLSSLGVMEHWNNAKDKKYSKNLGKKDGIELIQATIQ